MVTYIYFVKCPNHEDEHFDFFDEAKEFALGRLSQKPIITQTEVCRNDFGECTDHCDLGTVWSWEDVMREPDTELTKSIFTKDDFGKYNPDNDPEFTHLDNSLEVDMINENDQRLAVNKKGEYLVQASSGRGYTVFNRNDVCIGGLDCDTDEEAIRRFNLGDLDEAIGKPIPEGMTIEQLVEEMEENEDMVECAWCEELVDKTRCKYETRFKGYLCPDCIAAALSRGETLAFRENNYWDFLDEDTEDSSSADNTSASSDTNKNTPSETLFEVFSFKPNEKLALEYDKITAPITTDYHSATYWDPAEWTDTEVTDSFTYEVPVDMVVTAFLEDILEDEDVKEVPGGFDTLYKDLDARKTFFETNFDKLVKKYYKQLLDFFEDFAREAASERFQWEYDNWDPR